MLAAKRLKDVRSRCNSSRSTSGSDHRVRNAWAYVESLDLSELYASIQATRDNVGRDPIDPRILFALWLFATIEGTTSARRIAKWTERDIPYL